MTNIETLQHWTDGDNHCALITSPISARYLTGFGCKGCVAAITKRVTYFIVESKYYETAKKKAEGCEIVLMGDIYEQLEQIFRHHGIEKVSIESDYMNISQLAALTGRFSWITLDTGKRLSQFLENQRIVKTAEELEKIKTAQRITERAFSRLLSAMKVGMTERQIAALLSFFMLEYGADGIDHDTMVASGINSSIPYAAPTDKKVQEGEFLILDFGAVVDGYHSSMCRTVVFGQPDDEMKNVYNAVWGADTDALKAVRDGISTKIIDNVARATLQAWSYEEYFTHPLGDGIGLEAEEPPSLYYREGRSLRTGMVIAVHPGVYLPGKYGVRIQDLCVVTGEGCELITNAPRTLIYI